MDEIAELKKQNAELKRHVRAMFGYCCNSCLMLNPAEPKKIPFTCDKCIQLARTNTVKRRTCGICKAEFDWIQIMVVDLFDSPGEEDLICEDLCAGCNHEFFASVRRILDDMKHKAVLQQPHTEVP